MLDFDYNWTEPQMRSWLAVKEPQWDWAFKDDVRLRACIDGFTGEERSRITSLITAYWSGRLTTSEFVRRFEQGLWPASRPAPKPQVPQDANRAYLATLPEGDQYDWSDAPYGTDAAGRIIQERVEWEKQARAAGRPFPPLAKRLAAAESSARKRWPEAFEGIAPLADTVTVEKFQEVRCLACNRHFHAFAPALREPCPHCKRGRLTDVRDIDAVQARQDAQRKLGSAQARLVALQDRNPRRIQMALEAVVEAAHRELDAIVLHPTSS